MPVSPDLEKVEISLSSELFKEIRAEAERRGDDIHALLVEAVAQKAVRIREKRDGGESFAEILAPVHEYVRQTGETEEEIEAFIDAELAAFRREVNAK